MDGKNRIKQIAKIGLAAVAAMILSGPSIGVKLYAQEVNKLNRFIQASDRSDPAIRLFEEGRDLIQEEDWQAAGQKFSQFIKDYPRHDKTDAALYWLAFSLEHQQELQRALSIVDQLFRDYPQSSWIPDARAIRAEVNARGGHISSSAGGGSSEGGGSSAGGGFSEGSDSGSDNDELKVIALRSLFESNPAKASGIVNDILKPGSKAPLNLKRAALNLLAENGSKESLAVLESIVAGDKDAELRRTAAFWLGQSGSDHGLEVLKQAAINDKDEEVAKAAVFGISQARNPQSKQILTELATSSTSLEIKKAAIFGLVQSEGDAAIDQLIKIYDTDREPEIGKQITFALAQTGSPRAAAKLLEIAKTGYDPEVRKQAIFWLGQRPNSAELLISLYDSESDQETKGQILFALSQSGGKAGLKKLLDVASHDKSVDLRKRAIFWLGQSQDPEAQKFLEDILK